MNKKNKDYTAKNIRVLTDAQALRLSPSMYIGDTKDATHCAFELIDNAGDEFKGGYGTIIDVELLNVDTILVRDSGRGIPTEQFENTEFTALEILFIKAYSGSKFDRETYEESGGQHGLGLMACCALCVSTKVRVFRDDLIYLVEFSKGEIVTKQYSIKNTTEYKKGTEVLLIPDGEIFDSPTFDAELLTQKIYDTVAVNPGLVINFKNCITHEEKVYKNLGLEDYIKNIANGREMLFKSNISLSANVENIKFEIVLNWIKNTKEDSIIAFTNSIKQPDGGTHVNGIKNGLVKFATQELLRRKNIDSTPLYNDVRTGLVAIIHVHMDRPKFDTQTKHKLVSNNVRSIVENFVYSALYEVPEIEKFLIIVENNIYNRLLVKQASISNNDRRFSALLMNGRVIDCISKLTSENEVLLVEGLSAGGTARQCIDKNIQALIMIGGKIMNVLKASIDKAIESEVLTTIMSAIGINFTTDGVINIKNLRYGKIIILTDGDIDGCHISCLLLSLFHRYMREVITAGHLYFIKPPVYKLTYKNEGIYFNSQEDYIKFITNHIHKHLSSVEELELEHIVVCMRCLLEIRELRLSEISCFILDALINARVYDYEDIEEHSKIQKIKEFLGYSSYKFFVIQRRDSIDIESLKLMEKISIDKTFFNNDGFYKRTLALLAETDLSLEKMLKISNYVFDKIREGVFTAIHRISSILENNLMIEKFKGLGQLGAEQLWDTCLNPLTRNLRKITIKDTEEADYMLNILMGPDVDERRKFIFRELSFGKSE